MPITSHAKAHYDNMLRRMNLLNDIYARTAAELSKKIQNFEIIGKTDTYFWKRYRALEKQVDASLNKLSKNVLANIEGGMVESWDINTQGNDELVQTYIKGFDVPVAMQTAFFKQNVDALNALMNRYINGMNLSERVWNLTGKNSKRLMAEYLGSGILEGKSASMMSQDVRDLLQYPNKLFRRVRNDKGELVLSKKAKAFHPGQGVYRSSYKNALRLTGTETNISYRTADHLRHQQLPFVVGVEIHLSPAHPRPDICDRTQGKYPPGFKWTGWHPHCICYLTTELLEKERFRKYLQTGKIPTSAYRKTLPRVTWGWIRDHKQNMRNWKTLPYFMQDNFTNDFKLKKNVLK